MRLTCKTPEGGSVHFELQPLTRIGRAADNDIQVFDASASTYHCELTVANGAVIARDLGSANGIEVNGLPVQEAMLRHGSLLKVG